MMDLDAINEGFSREAHTYDRESETNPVMRWARRLVRRQIVNDLPVHSSILEINAGTGLDAAWLVEQGYRVHATDVADGMMAAIHSKIETSPAFERFTAQQLSFNQLEKVDGAPFDAVFSNFGGLNCTSDLSTVFAGVRQVLKPGGWVFLVVMPPVCPWELAALLRGRLHAATRRLHRRGVLANVAGSQIMTYYFTPAQVLRALGSRFEFKGLQSFSLFCPPMFMTGFSSRFPRLTRHLMRLDEVLGRLPGLRSCGDFFVLTARYKGIS